MHTLSTKEHTFISLGRAQMAEANIRINTSAQFKALAEIKKSKGYKGLRAIGPDGKMVTVTTFEDFCTRLVGMSREHVDRNIRLLESLGDGGFEAAQEKQLGYREMLKIARLPDDLKEEAVQSLISEDADRDAILEVVEDLAIRNGALRIELASAEETAVSLNKKITNRDIELETHKTLLKSLEEVIVRRGQHDPFPDFVMATRHESAAFAEQALLCFDDLTRLDDELHETAATATGDDVNIALTSLYTHVNALSARAQQLVAQMQRRWGDALPQAQTAGQRLYSDDELDELAAARELLVRDHERNKTARANQREDAKPRGRGRPKKRA